MPLRSVLFFFLAAICGVNAQTGCISVTATDYKGVPLANMHSRVTRYAGEFWHPDTDGKGRFTLTGLPPGKYMVALRNEELGYMDTVDNDFSNLSSPYYVVESGRCTEINIQFEPAARLHLKLTDEETGKFIAAPEAQFRRVDGHHAWNGVTKRGLDLMVPPLKPLEVRVGAKGYKSTAPISIPPLDRGEIRDFDLVLKPIGLGCLRGRVMDADGQPVAGVEVQPRVMNDSLNSKAFTVKTNQDGEFEMNEMPPGTYEFFVHSQEMGYSSMSMLEKDGRPPQVEVRGSETCAEVTVNLSEPNGKLTVDVIDAITQAPLEHFRFEVKSTVPKWWWSEGKEWSREVQMPLGREFSLQAEAEGYETSQPMPLVPFKSGEVRKIRIALQPVQGH